MRYARHIGLHIYPSFYARQIGQKKHRVFVKLRKNPYRPAVFKAHRQDYWQIPEHYHQVINSACVNPLLSVQLVHVDALNPLYRAGGETFWRRRKRRRRTRAKKQRDGNCDEKTTLVPPHLFFVHPGIIAFQVIFINKASVCQFF